MAYNEFAYFYDEFNGEADYDALYRYITAELQAHGIRDGILADLGCGTGDLTLMLTQAGYDVIGIDRSEEMLSVLREKADELGLTGRLLLLRRWIWYGLGCGSGHNQTPLSEFCRARRICCCSARDCSMSCSSSSSASAVC